MIIKLDQLYINLKSDIDCVQREWMNIFALQPLADEQERWVDIELSCNRLCSQILKRWSALGFIESTRSKPGFHVYQFSLRHFLLRLPNGIYIEIDVEKAQSQIFFPPSISTKILPEILEDITTIALGPNLRRRGYLLLHGFGAGINGEGVLFCGPSGSGKTTTGLAFLAAGGSLYANDNLLIRQEKGCLVLAPSFGTVNLTQKTRDLMDEGPFKINLVNLDRRPVGLIDQKIHLSPALMQASGVNPLPIKKIVFVDYRPENCSITKESVQKGEQIARLLSDGVDQWDLDVLDAQVGMLTALVEQAKGFILHLPHYNRRVVWEEIVKEVIG